MSISPSQPLTPLFVLFPPSCTFSSASFHPTSRPCKIPSTSTMASVFTVPSQQQLLLQRPYWIASTSDKTPGLSDEAKKELLKASTAVKAQSKGIEMYSGSFYAACILGGLLACVHPSFP